MLPAEQKPLHFLKPLFMTSTLCRGETNGLLKLWPYLISSVEIIAGKRSNRFVQCLYGKKTYRHLHEGNKLP